MSLEVTPQITPDNSVIMEVIVTKDEPDYMNKVQDVPPIRKNEVRGKVLVRDGETIVIGGVFSNTQSKVVDKVPFLGDLPYVGRLFRRDVVLEKKIRTAGVPDSAYHEQPGDCCESLILCEI